jgi:starch-binding outer membrane protein, SusD/RagB family
MKHTSLLRFVLVGMVFLTVGCTKLVEQVLDESSVTGLTEKQLADGIIAPVYAGLPSLFQHTTYFALQEISTDEAILPYRGGTDWGDNGIYVALHRHELTSTDPNVRNTWTIVTLSISRAVTAMNSLKDNKDPNSIVYLAEAKAMYAYYNMVALDLWGVAFKKDDLGAASIIIRGDEAVEYIKKQFLEAEPNLTTTVGAGRITKAGVWGLLARLHLNAGVYRDPYATTVNFKTEDLDKVNEYTTKVISSNQYAFSTDYWAMFNDENNSNKELIFTVDQRSTLNGHNRLSYFMLSGDQFPLPAYVGANGTDGPGITPDFYRTWVNAYGQTDPAIADPRFYQKNLNYTISGTDTSIDQAAFKYDRGILRGQQYGLLRVNGVFLKLPNGRLRIGKLHNVTRSKPNLPVNFTEQIDFTTAGSDYSTGYRVAKFEFSKGSVSGRNFGEVDIPIVRLADVYLMRAEAKLRKNDAAGALTDVNAVRTSRTANFVGSTLPSITLDLLFRERGFELYYEMVRRTDMIRFGKYEGVWTEKNNTNKNMRLMPIPQTAIDGASNLPGYLKQNPGY